MSNIARFLMMRDAGNRLVTLGIDAAGGPVTLTALMVTPSGRRGEGESVTVSFGPAASIIRGMRGFFSTGTPAARGDDQRQGLLPTDTAQIKELAKGVRHLCRE